MNHCEYEMIIVVVNAGYSDLVMDAAKQSGAGGGTVIRARGTANREAEKFFNISIQPEKDVVLLIINEEKKDEILHAVYKEAGLSTLGQGIAFSVPVSSAVGLCKEYELKK